AQTSCPARPPVGALPAIAVVAGNAPAPKLGQSLSAEARSASAEEHERGGPLTQAVDRVLSGGDVVAPRGNKQEGQRSGLMRPTQRSEASLQLGKVCVERSLT